MSTYWDLVCVDHDSSAGFDGWNRADEELALLWRHRAELLDLYKLAGEIFDIDEVSMTSSLRPIRWEQRYWLGRHRGCHVQLLNEYGDRLDVDSMAKLPPKHCASCTCEPR